MRDVDARPGQSSSHAPAPSAVFLDRDGVINRKAHGKRYVTHWSEFAFLSGALEALAILAQLPTRVVVITNQRGVARGHLTRDDLNEIHAGMQRALRDTGAHLDAIYACVHDEDACSCRKPRPGLIHAACADFPDIDPSTAFLVGDSASDVATGWPLGCRPVLVGRGKHLSREMAACRRAAMLPVLTAASLLDAVERHVKPAFITER
jgi:histidinol-phosphate phosphatase family protein